MAARVTKNLQLADSTESVIVRIPLSPPPYFQQLTDKPPFSPVGANVFGCRLDRDDGRHVGEAEDALRGFRQGKSFPSFRTVV